MHSGAKQKQPCSAVFRRRYTYLICVHNVPYALLHIRYIFKQQIRRLPRFSQAGQFKEESAAWISKSFSGACNAESLVILNFGITRRSAPQAPEKDSEIRAALSSLNWPGWLKSGSLSICCLKMYLMHFCT